ncbi:3-ketoacyl-ACP reductase [bacterium]|nr:3-ketoacyl-ACP reductase [bacterium]
MTNPVALITGAARGIGYAIAEHLAKARFDIVINDIIDEESLSNKLSAIEKLGSAVLTCQADISKKSDREKMLTRIKEKFGKINILVNNAGVAPLERKDILEASEESFDRLININLKGPYFLTQSIANWMITLKNETEIFEGAIINITSISATVASPNRGEYCISKAGLSMSSKLWSVRLAEFGIPVYEIRPGIIKTDMTVSVREKYDKLINEGLTLQKRWGLPDDVGKAVASLARRDFPYSTGQVITVDGGLTIERL